MTTPATRPGISQDRDSGTKADLKSETYGIDRPDITGWKWPF